MLLGKEVAFFLPVDGYVLFHVCDHAFVHSLLHSVKVPASNIVPANECLKETLLECGLFDQC